MALHGVGILKKLGGLRASEPVLWREVAPGWTGAEGQWIEVARYHWVADDTDAYAVKFTVSAVTDFGASGQIRARSAYTARVTHPMAINDLEPGEFVVNRPLPWLPVRASSDIVILEARVTTGVNSGGLRVLRDNAITILASLVPVEPNPIAGQAFAYLGGLVGSATMSFEPSGLLIVRNTIRPSVIGAPSVGAELLGDAGTWENVTRFEYQWQEETALVESTLTATGDLGGLTASGVLTFSSAAATPFSLVASGSLPFSSSSTRSVVLPSTVAVGDLIEIYITAAAAGDPGEPTATGFTRLYSTWQGSNYRPRVSLLYKVATLSDIGATVTVTATPGISERNIVSWAVWRGVSTTTPYGATPTVSRSPLNANNGNYDPPAIAATLGHVVMTHIAVENVTTGIPQAANYTRVIHQLTTFTTPSGATSGLNQAVQWKRATAATEDPPVVTGTSRMWEAITRSLNVLAPVVGPDPGPDPGPGPDPEPDPEPEPVPPGVAFPRERVALEVFGNGADVPYRPNVSGAGPPFAAHEARPSTTDLPASFDFHHGGRPGTSGWGSSQEILPWYHVFAAADNTVWNVRVQTRRPRLYFRRSDGSWYHYKNSRLPNTDPERTMQGTLWGYPGKPFQGSEKLTPQDHGVDGMSLPLSGIQGDRCVVHGVWAYYVETLLAGGGWDARVRIPSGVVGYMFFCQARLIPGAAGVNAAAARFLLAAGADKYPKAGPGELPAWIQPRMKLLKAGAWSTIPVAASWFGGFNVNESFSYWNETRAKSEPWPNTWMTANP